MTDDKTMCEDFEKSGAVFPKVSPALIDAMMKDVVYEASIVPGTTTTVVVSYRQTGVSKFTLAVATMACADPRKFNKDKGIQYCTEKCEKLTRDKLWELEYYLLAATAFNKPTLNFIQRMQQEYTELSKKIYDLGNFIQSNAIKDTPEYIAYDLQDQLVHMSDYAAVLQVRINKALESK
jgi:hypothetical protein